MLDGTSLALIGAGISSLAGVGSLIGTYYIAGGGAGLVPEKPESFGSVLLTSALPSSQGIYGFLASILILQQAGIIGGAASVTTSEGMMLMLSGIPVGLLGLFSGAFQGKVLQSGLRIIAANTGDAGKSVILGVLLESMAVFGLLLSIIIISNV